MKIPRVQRLVMRWLLVGWALLALCAPAWALKPISVSPDQDRIEITSLGEFYDSRGDSLQLEMVASNGAATGRMNVRAVTAGTNPSWIAFALTNESDKAIERWLTAERYTMLGSGIIWPDLDARRVEALTPSLGFVPERIKNERADIFRITLEPGQTITYVAEMSGDRFARVYLWKPIDYELKVRDRQLFNGVLLGLTGLLAIFLTSVFAANHKAIFPSAALVAWCVLAHLMVDFGFFHKLFQLRSEDNAVYRAATEAATAASLVIFIHTFLRLVRSPSLVRMLLTLWMAGQLALVAIAVIDPRLASTFARLSFAMIGAIGGLTTVYLALRNDDRALALIPTWLLFLVWVFAAGLIATGRLATDLASSGLIAGLVLIVVLIGFTVTQFAFRSLEPAFTGQVAGGETQLSALAVQGAGAAIFEWFPKKSDVKCNALLDIMLGLVPGELSTKLPEFLKHVHEADRERLSAILLSAKEQPGASLQTEFRLRHADSSARWYELDAASVPGPDQRAVRFVGLLRETTHTKRAHDRLVQDAVYCSLTGLPNRALFVDRLTVASTRARNDRTIGPAILLLDLDDFKAVNTKLGLALGDSVLLTLARRLSRAINPGDTLARIATEQFAILYDGRRDLPELTREAERVRRAVRAPIKISGQDTIVTASLGLAMFDPADENPLGLMEDALSATVRARGGGPDRIELFMPEMRSNRDQRRQLEDDLRAALANNQLTILYQPMIYLPTEELAGFEAVVTWNHPKLGMLDPFRLTPPITSSELIGKVTASVLNRATADAARWQKELPRSARPLFVSINISSLEAFGNDLARDVRQILDQGIVNRGTLRLEISESAVMHNPEQSCEVLESLRSVGADLTLDGFGAGFSSIAYLDRFAVDTVKIDRAFVEAAGGGESPQATIVRSMVALALELNKKVSVDGVEDPQDAAFLRSIGCAYAQGFYYGDPMPDKEVIQLLKLVRKSEHQIASKTFFKMATRNKKKIALQTPTDAGTASANGANGAGSDQPSRKKIARKKSLNNQSSGSEAQTAQSRANGASSHDAGTANGLAALAPLRDGAVDQDARGHAAPRTPPSYIQGVQPPTPATYPQPIFQVNPLSSLQASLDALNQRATRPEPAPTPELLWNASQTARETLQDQPAGRPVQQPSLEDFQPPFQPQAPGHGPAWPQQQQQPQPITRSRPSYADDLADVFNRAAPSSPLPSDALEKLAKVVAQVEPAPTLVRRSQSGPVPVGTMAPRPVSRVEPVVRVRPVRPPPDLSKLPPGLAASLAKLAGAPAATPPSILAEARERAKASQE